MKLKFYLRGLGIGIVVTAILLHFSLGASDNGTMTDDEVRARALELGMMESTVLSENSQSQNDATQGQGVSGNEAEGVPDNSASVSGNQPEEVAQNVTGSSENYGEDTSEEEELVEETTPEDNTEVQPEESGNTESESEESEPGVATNTEMVIITVYSGDGSDTVARRLVEAGVVSSATEYDAYLCANGYDKRICTGNHEIPVGATYEEIAIIITTRN